MAEQKQQRVLLKLLLLGDSGTGKTSLVVRLVDDQFSLSTKSTIGADFLNKEFEIQPSTGSAVPVNAQIWDTAGKASLSGLGTQFYRGTDAFGIVVTPDNLDTVRQHYNKIRDETGSDAHIFFIVNKTDVPSQLTQNEIINEIKRQLPQDDKNPSILFCSAKDNTNVEKAFRAMAVGALEYSNRAGQQN